VKSFGLTGPFFPIQHVSGKALAEGPVEEVLLVEGGEHEG
jgi:hypothetical protein